MPNSDAPVSRVEAIRQYLTEHPDASPKAVAKALVAQGFEIPTAFAPAVQASPKSTTQSGKSVNELFVKLGKAQVDAMFRRQGDDPVDDSEFLPLVEAALNAFETAGIDEVVVEAVWEHAFHTYDQACKEVAPQSTTGANRRLMKSYLLGKARKR